MRKLLFVSRITVLTLLSLRRLESTIACNSDGDADDDGSGDGAAPPRRLGATMP
jgi:hypothetical protein